MAENENKRKPTDSIEFYIGLFLLVVGLFYILNKTVVSSGWGLYSWSLGGFHISSGLVIVPLIVGIVWMFYNPKSIVAKVVAILGGVLIIASIIASITIRFTTTSLFDYIIMIALMASGCGLLLKAYFKK